MVRFVTRENIGRYRRLASEPTDAAEGSQIIKLLAEKENKLTLNKTRQGDAAEGQSTVNAATGDPVAHDGKDRQSGC